MIPNSMLSHHALCDLILGAMISLCVIRRHRRFACPVVPGLMQWFYPQRLSLENRNILYFTVDTALQGLMMGGVFSFISIFLVRLGASELQASLLTSLPAIVMVIVSVPAGQLVERQQDLVRFTNLIRVFHRGSILVVALLPFFVPHDPLIAIIILIWTIKANANALLESSWMAVVADVIPPHRRAKVNGTRWIILSVVTAAAVAVFGQMLDRLPFPLSYQLVFFISFLGGSAGMIYWSKLHLRDNVKSPAVEAPETVDRAAGRAFWQSLKLPAFIRYEAATSVFRLALHMPTALYSIYWIRQLRASDVWIGWHATANQVALIVGYAVWGKVITRKGHRWPLLHLCGRDCALSPVHDADTRPVLAAHGRGDPGLLHHRREPLLLRSPAGGLPGGPPTQLHRGQHDVGESRDLRLAPLRHARGKHLRAPNRLLRRRRHSPVSRRCCSGACGLPPMNRIQAWRNK
jgi:MFS family permease